MSGSDFPKKTDLTDPWPSLPYRQWKETYQTLHMWTQIVGKIRMVLSPCQNHSWHTTLYLTARGLTTSPIPYQSRVFAIDFDFVDHHLRIQTAEGEQRELVLGPRSVADFYAELFARLDELGLETRIHTTPNEVVEAIPFHKDTRHATYVPEQANCFFRALAQADRLLKRFRAEFTGKCSPVHFFWGSFDLAVSRFSGRRAPEHPGGIPHLPDWVVREAYSHEVMSAGFWPGSEQLPEAVFYAYAYPEPRGFAAAPIQPAAAAYQPEQREFILPYDEVRRSYTPDALVLDFLRSTYRAAANLGDWPRGELEWAPPGPAAEQ